MVFGRKLEQTLTLQTIQIVSSCPKYRLFGVWYEKFFDCVFFDGESFVHATLYLLQLNVCFCTCFQRKKCVFECESTRFWHFWVFLLVRARALYVSVTALAKTAVNQLKTLRVLLHNVTSTRKAVGVLFWTHFVWKKRFSANLAKNHLEMLLEECWNVSLIASSMMLLVWGALHSTKKRIQKNLKRFLKTGQDTLIFGQFRSSRVHK